jgi:hypothetical protein
MIVLENLDVETRVSNAVNTQQGMITEIRMRRPAMAHVQWDNGSSGWYHPEQLSLPCALNAPAETSKTTWGRTTPEYLVDLQTQLRRQTKPQRPPADYRVTRWQAMRKVLVENKAPNRHDLKALGMDWPPPKGWKKRLLRELKTPGAKRT